MKKLTALILLSAAVATHAASVTVEFNTDNFEVSAGKLILKNAGVINAIGYAPVNKTGDTMTGPLLVTALTNNALTASRVLVSGSDKSVASSSVTATTLGYLDATSSIQTQIDAKAPIASPTLTGNPLAPTPTGGDNDTSIATTAFVQTELSTKAPLADPVFTGNPTVPTASPGDNDTSAASTAFVTAAVAASPTTNIVMTGLGTTTVNAFSVTNSTAAAAGAQQISPAIQWGGNGWATTPVASHQVAFRAYVLPVQGGTTPSGSWFLESNRNGAGWTSAMSVDNNGSITAAGSILPSSSGFVTFASRSKMSSPANGTMLFQNNAGTAVAGIQAARPVVAKTADYTVLFTDSDTLFHNSGAAGAVTFTLPTWAAGLTYTFEVETAQNIVVDAPGTDTIRIAASVSAAGGNLTANTIGNAVTITATVSGKWVATATVGTWTVN